MSQSLESKINLVGLCRKELGTFFADLCEKSFLKLWSYPNPYKEDHDELCDLLVVFENTKLVSLTAPQDYQPFFPSQI